MTQRQSPCLQLPFVLCLQLLTFAQHMCLQTTSTCTCACNLRRKRTEVGYDLLSILKHMRGQGVGSPGPSGQHHPCLLQRYRDLLFGSRM